jgi:hypothetical protein
MNQATEKHLSDFLDHQDEFEKIGGRVEVSFLENLTSPDESEYIIALNFPAAMSGLILKKIQELGIPAQTGQEILMGFLNDFELDEETRQGFISRVQADTNPNEITHLSIFEGPIHSIEIKQRLKN